jgi:hypothetical protein
MAVRLNNRGYQHGRALIDRGLFVVDDQDAWSEHRPSAQRENAFLAEHGIDAYGRWHLGIDDEAPEGRKGRYKFPYGDFAQVHRCGILAAEVRAGQYGYVDIENAAAHLHGLLDAPRQ